MRFVFFLQKLESDFRTLYEAEQNVRNQLAEVDQRHILSTIDLHKRLTSSSNCCAQLDEEKEKLEERLQQISRIHSHQMADAEAKVDLAQMELKKAKDENVRLQERLQSYLREAAAISNNNFCKINSELAPNIDKALLQEAVKAANLTKANKELQKEILELKDALAKKEAVEERLHYFLDRQSYYEQMEQRCADLESEIADLQQRNQKPDASILSFVEAAAALESKAEAEARLKHFQNKLANLEQELHLANESIKIFESERDHLKQRLLHLESALQSTHSRNEVLKSDLELMEKTITRLTSSPAPLPPQNFTQVTTKSHKQRR